MVATGPDAGQHADQRAEQTAHQTSLENILEGEGNLEADGEICERVPSLTPRGSARRSWQPQAVDERC